MTENEFARLASSELPRLQGDSRGTSFSYEQLQRTFAKADLNGDGEVDFNEFFLWLSGGAKGESRNASPALNRGGAADGAAGGAAGGAAPIEGRKEFDERLLKETERRHVHRACAQPYEYMHMTCTGTCTCTWHAHAHAQAHAHAHACTYTYTCTCARRVCRLQAGASLGRERDRRGGCRRQRYHKAAAAGA